MLICVICSQKKQRLFLRKSDKALQKNPQKSALSAFIRVPKKTLPGLVCQRNAKNPRSKKNRYLCATIIKNEITQKFSLHNNRRTQRHIQRKRICR